MILKCNFMIRTDLEIMCHHKVIITYFYVIDWTMLKLFQP